MTEKIQQVFSAAAPTYEELTGFHKARADEIRRFLVGRGVTPTSILDVGMGTGWLTAQLCQQFSSAQVVGIDSAPGMVHEARARDERYCVTQADAQALPFGDGVFDVVVSNCCYQWVADLPQAFREAQRVLSSSGVFCAQAFGYHTFCELFETIAHCRGVSHPVCDTMIGRLPTVEMYTTALAQAGFSSYTVTSQVIRMYFPTMHALIVWTKAIGANALRRNFFVGKNLFSAMNDHYNRTYHDQRGVYATFEIVTLQAQK